jgi:hypothetical protein
MYSVSGTGDDEDAARFVLKYWVQEIVEGQIDVLTGSSLIPGRLVPAGEAIATWARHATASDPEVGVYYCPETP